MDGIDRETQQEEMMLEGERRRERFSRRMVGTIVEVGEPMITGAEIWKRFVTAVYQMGRVFRYTATIMRL